MAEIQDGDVYQCDKCDGWHISDEALERLGMTDQEVYEAALAAGLIK